MTFCRKHRALGTLLLAGALAVAGCTAPGPAPAAPAALVPVKPAQPVDLTVLDGGGDLATNKPILENFKAAHPDLVRSISYQTSSGPDATGKVKAQQVAGRLSIGLVLGGTDVLGGAERQSLLLRLLPGYASSLPDLNGLQDTARRQLQDLAGGYGVVCVYTPSGPLVGYDAGTVSAPPRTPAELLAWAQAHKGRFTYAQPANSGSGRTFLMSLPYLLGDSDPGDPVNGWTKTWAYLKELGATVSSYPASSTILAKQFGDGTVQVIPTIIAHDTQNHRTGVWSAQDRVALFDNQQWVSDAHFMMVPKGVSAQTLYVDLALMTYLLRPDQQVLQFDQGMLTAATSTVDASAAGPAGQAYLRRWGRPDFYPTALRTGTPHPPLPPVLQQKAFDIWQREVGSHAGG
ncbi:MAG TPA: extracellular solute-binding protein [Rugosimonospora sp.]|nr:extracellular solute-binding protein [Rugosimonospora sp.]